MGLDKITMGRGRPKKEIDEKQFENLCALHCTEEEISDFFFCDHKTLNAWCNRTYGENFSLIYKRFCNKGNISLRRSQMEIAKRNATMAIFLGKQYLGQKDVTGVELGASGEPCTVTFEFADTALKDEDENNNS